MEILYKVHNNLYVNLTNKCPYACTFCLRQTMDRIGESDRLWLEREPSVEEVKKEFEKFDMTQYNEVVFCGFGEPTERFDALKEIAAFVKEKYNKPIRINTNGAGSLINGRDIAPELKGLVDTVYPLVTTCPNDSPTLTVFFSVTVSRVESVYKPYCRQLKPSGKEEYLKLVRSKFGEESFDAMLSFAKACTKYVPHVVMTTVDTTISHEQEAQCQKICDEIGAAYRIRPWED